MCRSGGDHQFEWTSIEEADNCLLVLNDISGAGPETSQNNFETYVQFWNAVRSTDYLLQEMSDASVTMAVLVQVCTYEDDEFIRLSEAWAIAVE